MAVYSLSLNVPTGVGVGSSQSVRDMREKTVQVIGAFTGSLNIEVSLDGGANFTPSSTAITAPGLKSVPEPATHLRLRATAMSGTAPTAVVAGFPCDG
jgi:hypothetical protein